MRAGVIGLGNMGSALAAGLLNGETLKPEQLLLVNRSSEKVEAFRLRYPGVRAARNNKELAESCEIIFVCTRSGEVPAVLREISPVRHGAHVIMVNAGLDLSAIESACQGAASKLIPSVTMEIGRGVSLVCHGKNVSAAQKADLEMMLGSASMVKVVPEGDLNAATELTSCGPALMAEMMHQFSMAGVRHGGFDEDEAWAMVLETLVGTALTLEKGVTVEDIKGRVATKGGITEQGLKVLTAELPAVMDHMMMVTMAKQASVHGELTKRLV
ncbi:MAG: NAD(P)-binding domain-containing protein [Methanomassiliicoccales archaeon]|nr:NAD(P)-binding domain-containing protein [Methanomassiliicoccales archaeon]